MSREIDGKTYLTPPEVARELGVSRWTLHRWLQSQKLADMNLEAVTDTFTGRLYIDKASLPKLPRKRFVATTLGPHSQR
jgi:predicted site-specific integrase-resolvase